MCTFAIVPWTIEQYNDNVFNLNPPYNWNCLLEPIVELRDELVGLNHTVHTIDLYRDFTEIDYILFFALNWAEYHNAVQKGMDKKMVYCTAEPPSVFAYNSPEGYRLLKKIFPYILTWNDDWIDNEHIFKRCLPYWFVDRRGHGINFESRKLITCISGNKHSDYPMELYSERERAISFFEKNHPDEFDLYGTGWKSDDHLSYKGVIKDKAHIYHEYRFAICYENIEGMRGYITEKILDCLTSGIVPIYAGAPDICDYVPKECFIYLREYKDYEGLYNYISNIREDEYKLYLKAADEFIHSPMSDHFSGKKYAHYILDAVSHDKSGFKSSKIAYKLFKYKYHRYF